MSQFRRGLRPPGNILRTWLESAVAVCYKNGVLFGDKKKPRERYYLLPGQGGRNFHRKQKFIMRWVISVSLVCGALLGLVMWLLARQKP